MGSLEVSSSNFTVFSFFYAVKMHLGLYCVDNLISSLVDSCKVEFLVATFLPFDVRYNILVFSGASCSFAIYCRCPLSCLLPQNASLLLVKMEDQSLKSVLFR